MKITILVHPEGRETRAECARMLERIMAQLWKGLPQLQEADVRLEATEGEQRGRDAA